MTSTRKIRCIVCDEKAEVAGMRKICDPCRTKVDPTGCMTRGKRGDHYIATDNPWGRVDYTQRDGARRVPARIKPE